MTLKRNFRPLTDLAYLTREDMREVGTLAIEQIRRRTQAGTDAQGQAFAPYSMGYLTQRQKAGLGSRVTLQVSGEMLNNLQIVDVTDRRVVLGWVR